MLCSHCHSVQMSHQGQNMRRGTTKIGYDQTGSVFVYQHQHPPSITMHNIHVTCTSISCIKACNRNSGSKTSELCEDFSAAHVSVDVQTIYQSMHTLRHAAVTVSACQATAKCCRHASKKKIQNGNNPPPTPTTY